MPAMTRNFCAGGILPDGAPEYYGRRADGGAGLIITEGTAISHPVSDETDRVPDISSEAAQAAWRKVVARVQNAGSAIFLQLWHAGLLRKAARSRFPDLPSIGPSVEIEAFAASGRAARHKDIDDVIDAFAADARIAENVGFDGIEIHGAHGYLIDQFLSHRANARSDEYGGTLDDRGRFAVDIIEEIRRRVAPDFPVAYRFSQWKAWDYSEKTFRSPSDLQRFLALLSEAGVDLFHVSTRRFWEPAFKGSDLTLAGWTRRLTGRPVITVGSVGLAAPLRVGRESGKVPVEVTPENLVPLAALFARGEFDLVAVGRAFLANANWANAVRAHAFFNFRPYNPVDERSFLEW